MPGLNRMVFRSRRRSPYSTALTNIPCFFYPISAPLRAIGCLIRHSHGHPLQQNDSKLTSKRGPDGEERRVSGPERFKKGLIKIAYLDSKIDKEGS